MPPTNSTTPERMKQPKNWKIFFSRRPTWTKTESTHWNNEKIIWFFLFSVLLINAWMCVLNVKMDCRWWFHVKIRDLHIQMLHHIYNMHFSLAVEFCRRIMFRWQWKNVTSGLRLFFYPDAICNRLLQLPLSKYIYIDNFKLMTEKGVNLVVWAETTRWKRPKKEFFTSVIF